MTSIKESEKFKEQSFTQNKQNKQNFFETLKPLDKLLLSFNVKITNFFWYLRRKRRRNLVQSNIVKTQNSSQKGSFSQPDNKETTQRTDDVRDDQLKRIHQMMDEVSIDDDEDLDKTYDDDGIPDANLQNVLIETRGFPDMIDQNCNNVSFDVKWVKANLPQFEGKVKEFLEKYNLTYNSGSRDLIKPIISIIYSPDAQVSNTKKRKISVTVKGSPNVITPKTFQTKPQGSISISDVSTTPVALHTRSRLTEKSIPIPLSLNRYPSLLSSATSSYSISSSSQTQGCQVTKCKIYFNLSNNVDMRSFSKKSHDLQIRDGYCSFDSRFCPQMFHDPHNTNLIHHQSCRDFPSHENERDRDETFNFDGLSKKLSYDLDLKEKYQRFLEKNGVPWNDYVVYLKRRDDYKAYLKGSDSDELTESINKQRSKQESRKKKNGKKKKKKN